MKFLTYVENISRAVKPGSHLYSFEVLFRHMTEFRNPHTKIELTIITPSSNAAA